MTAVLFGIMYDFMVTVQNPLSGQVRWFSICKGTEQITLEKFELYTKHIKTL